MLIVSFAATRDVNNSVIALQKDIIAAQTSIKAASDVLVEQKQKLTEFALATRTLTNARSKLEAATSRLDKARGDYEGLTKATTNAESKLTTATSLSSGTKSRHQISHGA
jgi:predicted  nucleic acid-binding Zn-ribbon protein